MYFLTFVLKNVTRRRLRSLLTIAAIAIAVGAMIALVSISSGFIKSYMQLYEELGVDLIVFQSGVRQRLTSSLKESLGDEFLKIPGVRDVLPGSLDVVSFTDYDLYGVIVNGWVPESTVWTHLQLVEGRFLKTDDANAVVLGMVLADSLNKKVGDTVEILEGEPFNVVGIYQSFNVFENGAMVVPLTQLQRLMDRPGQVTGFSIVTENSRDADLIQRVKQQIENIGKRQKSGLTVMAAHEHVESILEIQLAKGMAWLTSTVALIIGAVGIMNTMVMSVHERTREIGVLRAVGWRQSRIVRMILGESIVLAIIGAAVGSVGAMLLVRGLTQFKTVKGLIEGQMQPDVIAMGFFVALLVGLVGGLLPAVRAGRMLPTTALRHE